MNISKTDINEIVELLSIERLYAIPTDSDSKGSVTDAFTIRLHQESLSLSGDLMSIVGVIEIALRNVVYRNLNQYFKTNDKFFQSPKPFEWSKSEKKDIVKASNFAKRAKYDKMSYEQKRHLQKQAAEDETFQNAEHHKKFDIVCSPISVSDSDMIAKLMFNFWKKMYSDKYDEALWHKTLKNTFPNAKNIHKSIIKHLEIIIKTRDRLAHHEPIWLDTFNKTIRSIQFITQNLNQPTQNPNSPLAKLLANDIKKIQAKADVFYAKISSKPATP